MSASAKVSRLLRLALVAGFALTAATCKDSPGTPVETPTPGWLSLSLATPNSDDGGVLFTIGGAAIDSVRSSQIHVVTRRESATTVRVVVAGVVGAGVIAEIRVPDTRDAAKYTAVIHEVAARTTYQQRPLTGYTLSVVPAAIR